MSDKNIESIINDALESDSDSEDREAMVLAFMAAMSEYYDPSIEGLLKTAVGISVNQAFIVGYLTATLGRSPTSEEIVKVSEKIISITPPVVFHGEI
jgi:hypothetical protein